MQDEQLAALLRYVIAPAEARQADFARRFEQAGCGCYWWLLLYAPQRGESRVQRAAIGAAD